MRDKNDFTKGSIVLKLLQFMIPILGALILQAMYGAVDILVVGRFGTTAGISGVSTGSSIVNLVTFTITGLTMGVTVVMGQYMGEKKPEKVGQVVGGAIWLFLVLACVIAAAMLVFARPLAVLMQAPQEALDLTVLYVRICGGGIFFIIAYWKNRAIWFIILHTYCDSISFFTLISKFQIMPSSSISIYRRIHWPKIIRP